MTHPDRLRQHYYREFADAAELTATGLGMMARYARHLAADVPFDPSAPPAIPPPAAPPPAAPPAAPPPPEPPGRTEEAASRSEPRTTAVADPALTMFGPDPALTPDPPPPARPAADGLRHLDPPAPPDDPHVRLRRSTPPAEARTEHIAPVRRPHVAATVSPGGLPASWPRHRDRPRPPVVDRPGYDPGDHTAPIDAVDRRTGRGSRPALPSAPRRELPGTGRDPDRDPDRDTDDERPGFVDRVRWYLGLP